MRTIIYSRGHQSDVASPQDKVAVTALPAIQAPAEVVNRSERASMARGASVASIRAREISVGEDIFEMMVL